MKSTETPLFFPYALQTDKKFKTQDRTYTYIKEQLVAFGLISFFQIQSQLNEAGGKLFRRFLYGPLSNTFP